MKKIAIQGGVGAYHGIAAENFFGEEVELIECDTFKDIFISIENDKEVIGVMAIENTIAGSLLPNYELLKKHECLIIGEYKQRISHCLATLPNQNLDEITEVHSHPMAIIQCEDFIKKYPKIKIVEHIDTALAARDIKKFNKKKIASICSERAADIYGLQILARGIETNKRNYTRFLIFAHQEACEKFSECKTPNKSSLVFSLQHKEGSLASILAILSFYGMNLTKIQSLPIIGQEWQYQFYADIIFESKERFNQAISAIGPLTSNLKIMGLYEIGRQSED